MTPAPKAATLYDLSAEEAVGMLSRHHVGRLAFTLHDRVDIEPISYVFANGWIYARTSQGTKLSIVKHHPWVAFQIDDVRSRIDWRSVVVHGTIYFLDADREADRADYASAVQILRSVDADALTSDDQTPHRQVLFRIHADEIIGRAAKP